MESPFNIVNFPVLIFVGSFIAFWLSTLVGASIRKRRQPLEKDQREDLNVVQGAALTLLSLLIGFTFSMAVSRYEQRKTYEEAEANTIGTEYLRASLLPASDASRVCELLREYLDQRVLYYTTRDEQFLRQVDANTAQLQNELWSTVQARAMTQSTPMTALSISGMNEVLDSQGRTEAAWRNRIPLEAWILLAAIAAGCNVLISYGAHRTSILSIVLPLTVSISFFLIADIDSPRGGVTRVRPENLVSLSQSLRTH